MQHFIKAYLAQDRQWPRRHRIAFAQRKLAQERAGEQTIFGAEIDAKAFWTSILKANGARA